MTDTNPGAPSPVHDLIRQREQLRGWLSRLGEVATGASSRVAERVRQDYQDRLRRVTEELSLYRDEITRDLDALRAELDAGEQRRAQATEVLEEARLRHLIGELDEGEWNRQEARLLQEVDAAGADVQRLGEEVERLAALAQDVGGEGDAGMPAEPEPAGEPPVAPELDVSAEVAPEPSAPPAAEEDVTAWLDEIVAESGGPAGEEEAAAGEEEPAEDLPWLEKAEQSEGWSPEGTNDLEFLQELDKPVVPEATESLADDDLAFLEELDRAISGSPAAPRAPTPPAAATPAPPAGDAGAERSTGSGPLLCKECGAINEPHSWYCEVCGSEL